MTAPATNDQDKPGLVPQPHGGALYRHGVKGNRGSNGRHPDRIRRIARSLLIDRLGVLGDIADGKVVLYVEDGQEKTLRPTHGERVAAVRELGKLGMGAAVNLADVRERLHQQVEVIRATLPPDVANELLKKLTVVWK